MTRDTFERYLKIGPESRKVERAMIEENCTNFSHVQHIKVENLFLFNGQINGGLLNVPGHKCNFTPINFHYTNKAIMVLTG